MNILGKKVIVKGKQSNYDAKIMDKLNDDNYLVKVTDDGGFPKNGKKGDANIISVKNIVSFIVFTGVLVKIISTLN